MLLTLVVMAMLINGLMTTECIDSLNMYVPAMQKWEELCK